MSSTKPGGAFPLGFVGDGGDLRVVVASDTEIRVLRVAPAHLMALCSLRRNGRSSPVTAPFTVQYDANGSPLGTAWQSVLRWLGAQPAGTLSCSIASRDDGLEAASVGDRRRRRFRARWCCPGTGVSWHASTPAADSGPTCGSRPTGGAWSSDSAVTTCSTRVGLPVLRWTGRLHHRRRLRRDESRQAPWSWPATSSTTMPPWRRPGSAPSTQRRAQMARSSPSPASTAARSFCSTPRPEPSAERFDSSANIWWNGVDFVDDHTLVGAGNVYRRDNVVFWDVNSGEELEAQSVGDHDHQCRGGEPDGRASWRSVTPTAS